MTVINFPVKGQLADFMDAVQAQEGGTKESLTVLSLGLDPFRCDTPAGHRNAAWFKKHVDELYWTTAKFHLRGLHYRIVASSLSDLNSKSLI
jgi:hypothetical protein